MKHISINVLEEIKNILPDTLEKDLQDDDEEICPVCHGLGVVLDNNIYRIEGDTSEDAKKSVFPYNHQAINFCPNCFNGVIRLCKYCNKPLKKGLTQCDCTDYKFREEIANKVRHQETIDKAIEIDINDIDSDIWFYDENMDRYFPDIDTFVEYYKDESLVAGEK